MNIQPEDYCALVCRDPNRLRLVNAHPEVVEVIERCLEAYSLDYDLYFKSKVTCAFKLHSQPFRKSGCSEDKTIKIKEIYISILVLSLSESQSTLDTTIACITVTMSHFISHEDNCKSRSEGVGKNNSGIGENLLENINQHRYWETKYKLLHLLPQGCGARPGKEGETVPRWRHLHLLSQRDGKYPAH